MEDETTFLCAFSRQRRYGTASDTTSKPMKIVDYVVHDVQTDDTIQRIALKYGSSMTEIKRINRLWSNESLYLKSVVRVPLYSDSISPTTSNGCLNRRASSASQALQSQRASIDSTQNNEDTSLSDILSRIDQNIKNTAKNVRRMEKASNVESVVELPASSSRQSLHNVSLDRSPSPEIRRLKSTPSNKSVRKIETMNDQFYQL